MAEEKEESGAISRREFLTKAGAAVIVGATAGLASCVSTATPTPALTPTATPAPASTPTRVRESGVTVHDATRCAGCGVCGMMCSLYHEGQVGPTLSRSELVRDPLNSIYAFNVCQQCRSPGCYLACPLKDQALCIDESTGARYVNEDKCDGCGKCVKACPFDPPRIRINENKKVAQKCDLCRGREEGPICVQYCGMQALRYLPGNVRQ